MSRPLFTPWTPFGRGEQCTLRRPLVDGEVWPRDDGTWAYRVRRFSDSSMVESGARATRDAAKARVVAVMDELCGGEE